MRGRYEKLLLVIEPDVDISPAHRKRGLVCILSPAFRPRERPSAAEIQRACHDDIALIILQPGGIHCLTIHWIDHDLGIKLSGGEGKDGARSMPGEPVVIAHEQCDAWCGTVRAIRHGPILRIEHVHVPAGIRRHRWLPLVTRTVSQARLRGKPGHSQRLNRCQCNQQYGCNFLHIPRTAMEVAGDKIHRTVLRKPCSECTLIPKGRQSAVWVGPAYFPGESAQDLLCDFLGPETSNE